VPGAPLASTTALTIPLGATRESEGKVSASVTAPAECTSTAGWKADAKFSDSNGHEASESKETTTACPAAGTRSATTTSVLPSRSSLFTEEGDSYTATVTPKAPSAFVPSGTATFREGPFTILGCEHVPVSAAAGSSGKAVCEAIPQEGTDQITAVYNGDSNFAPSESLPAAVTVSERNRAAEEATARKRTEEATARKRTEEAAAKKRAEEEAAANSKKKAEEEAAATKRSEEQAASRLDAEITASLLSALTPGGKAARLAAVRKHGSCVVSFSAPSAGELVISWYELPKGAHLSSAKPVLVASGRATTSAAGGVKLTIKLTAMGKRLLKASRSLKLTAKGTFTPAGHAATSTTKQFMLH
jgi:chemotaxis protein histidine kinase CheA